jgi:hypothetical protein
VVELDASFWHQPGASVGIVMTTIPVAGFYSNGNMGLVDMAIAQGVNKGLGTRLAHLDLAGLNNLPVRFEKLLTGKGFRVVKESTPLDQDKYPQVSLGDGFADHDYAALAGGLGVDALLVINLERIGTTRAYDGFLPKGPPAGYFKATGQLIEVKTKKLLWQRQVEVSRLPQAEWDQPPDFPNLTQKIQEAIDAGAGLLMVDFSWQVK